jgi:hypothetical protein
VRTASSCGNISTAAAIPLLARLHAVEKKREEKTPVVIGAGQYRVERRKVRAGQSPVVPYARGFTGGWGALWVLALRVRAVNCSPASGSHWGRIPPWLVVSAPSIVVRTLRPSSFLSPHGIEHTR